MGKIEEYSENYKKYEELSYSTDVDTWWDHLMKD